MASYKVIFVLLASATLTVLFYTTNNEYIDDTLLTPKNVSNDALFDIARFEYAINSDKCDTNINTVIIVTSYFGNVETRSAMRRAFPHKKLAEFRIKRVFLLGLAPKDKYTTQNAVVDESRKFNDLVQGNFLESYRNLTYKHVMGHKWVAERCENAKYVIKMDDDIVVDLYKLRGVLLDFKWSNENVMAGYVLKNMKPIREPHNKWFVRSEEYGAAIYPVFLSGWLYITTPRISQSIFQLSHRVPYFWIDDVYITGILAAKLKTKHVNLNRLFTVHPEFLRCCMSDLIKFGYECDFTIGPNGGDNNLYYEFNKVMRRCFYNVCGKRIKPLNQTCVAEKIIAVGRGEPQVNSFKLF